MQVRIGVTVQARRTNDVYCATAMKEKMWYIFSYRVRRKNEFLRRSEDIVKAQSCG